MPGVPKARINSSFNIIVDNQFKKKENILLLVHLSGTKELFCAVIVVVIDVCVSSLS